MKKIAFCFVASMLFLFAGVSAQEVDISMDHPDQVNAGQEFTVTVTIDKGSLSDYSRFSQDLPLGLTATNISSPNADFSFDNQRIRIIWLKLPEGNEVQVSYKILVNERLRGSFILGGVFAYVVADERKFMNFDKSTEITINPNPTIDPGLIVDIRDYKPGEDPAPTATGSEPFAMAVRQVPVLLGTGEYEVQLLVSNPNGSKYAKIEETIPAGYIAEEIESHDGIVSFAASTVKFIWMKLPDVPEYQVAYRLVPRQNETQGEMKISGLLTYTRGNENVVVEVKQMDVSLADLSPTQKKDLLATGTVPEGVPRATEVVQQTQQQTHQQEQEQVTRQETETRTQTTPPPTESRPATGSGNTIENTKVLGAGSGVYYRVQIAALTQPFDARAHYRGVGVDQEVMVEQHEGYHKYTAGSFQTYSQAAAYRDRVEVLQDVEGSFVVAYRDGRRIPISAANR